MSITGSQEGWIGTGGCGGAAGRRGRGGTAPGGASSSFSDACGGGLGSDACWLEVEGAVEKQGGSGRQQGRHGGDRHLAATVRRGASPCAWSLAAEGLPASWGGWRSMGEVEVAREGPGSGWGAVLRRRTPGGADGTVRPEVITTLGMARSDIDPYLPAHCSKSSVVLISVRKIANAATFPTSVSPNSKVGL